MEAATHCLQQGLLRGDRAEGSKGGKDPILSEEEGLILKRECRMGSKVFNEYLLNENERMDIVLHLY